MVFSQATKFWKAMKLEWENEDFLRCRRLSKSVTKRIVSLKKSKVKASAYQMFYFYSIYDHFAFICYVSLAENQKKYSEGAKRLGPLILPGSVCR